jgi:hypothetical protein
MDKTRAHVESDEHIGAVEGDQSNDPQPGNANAGALDEQGLPEDQDRIAADVIGAQEDETEG